MAVEGFYDNLDPKKIDFQKNLTDGKTGSVEMGIISDLGYNDSGALTKDYGYNVRKILTNPLAKRVFKYPSSYLLVENLDDLRDFIIEHQESQVPRLEVLDSYYMGNNISIYEAERRRLDSQKSDIRIANGYAKLITDTQVSYITVEPISISTMDKDFKSFLDDFEVLNDINSHNKDLINDMSVYGRAYEQLYRTEEGDFIGISDVFSTFIIYDLTIQKKPIAAVRYLLFDIEDVRNVSIELYTSESVYTFEPTPFTYDLELKLKVNTDNKPNPIINPYNQIPIIEYRNTNRGIGDFEDVIDLIDAYDSAQSDTANYSNDTPDAMYQITGRLADSLNAKPNKGSNMSYLKPGLDPDGKEYSLKGEYVNPVYDVSSIEAFKKRLVSDIHKQSKTPDLSDEHFGGNQSGIAMQYKLYGIDQSSSLKMNEFIRGAKKRYKALIGIKNNIDNENLEYNVNELTFVFKKNVPLNKNEILKTVKSLWGTLSHKTLIDTIPFINTDEELLRLEEQRSLEETTIYSDVKQNIENSN